MFGDFFVVAAVYGVVVVGIIGFWCADCDDCRVDCCCCYRVLTMRSIERGRDAGAAAGRVVGEVGNEGYICIYMYIVSILST